MLIITHLTITLLSCLIFFPFFDKKILFLIVALISSIIPDLDSPNSKIGKIWFFRPINFFTKHRGFFHSLIFLGIFFFLLKLISLEIAYAFLLGYGLHLISDCLTLQGIRLFYPFKFKIRGFIKTGGIFETTLLISCLLIILFLMFKVILSIF